MIMIKFRQKEYSSLTTKAIYQGKKALNAVSNNKKAIAIGAAVVAGLVAAGVAVKAIVDHVRSKKD